MRRHTLHKNGYGGIDYRVKVDGAEVLAVRTTDQNDERTIISFAGWNVRYIARFDCNVPAPIVTAAVKAALDETKASMR